MRQPGPLGQEPGGGVPVCPQRLKVLSLCGTFPNPCEPNLGPFSRARLAGLADSVDVKVIAPIAPFDFDNPARCGLGLRSVPLSRQDGRLEVLHPAWVYLPGNLAVNGICLAASLVPVVARLRRTFRFDLIDAHFAHPDGVAGWLLARLFRCPLVIRLYGNELVNSHHRFRRLLIGFALRRATRLVAVSDELRDLAISLGADPRKIRVIPNGVDASVFFPRRRRASERRLIVAAGRLVESKGHHHVIAALRILRERGIDAELIIAGGAGRGLPSTERHLRKLVTGHGLDSRVRLLGWIPPEQLADWMSAADVFCLASRHEGCPNVVIEALACGAPVVATDVGMVRRLVPSDRYGLLVQAGDPLSLAAALERALKQGWDREAIAAWGQSRSWTDAAREMQEQLLVAAGRHPAATKHPNPCASR